MSKRIEQDPRPKVLIVGQTPPPYGGQAMMIEQLVRADFSKFRKYHVRMGFATSMSSLGRFRVGKLLHLTSVIWRALVLRFRRRVSVLYYPPSGPTPAAILRDMFLLAALRPFFAKVIFHFHAAGVSTYLSAKPVAFRLLAKAAFGRPLAAIQPSALAPSDAQFFGARRVAIIPNGVADSALPYVGELAMPRHAHEQVRVLFVGAISEIKGTMVLLEAVRELARRRSDFAVWFMGEFISSAYERTAREFCHDNALEKVVSFLGMRIEDAKWQVFRDADILCLPSFLESFGNVLLEAMMFELPVVATRVGGIPDIVDPEVTGYLLRENTPEELSTALEKLIANRALREAMGRAGRQRYLERYTLDVHLGRMEQFLHEILASPSR